MNLEIKYRTLSDVDADQLYRHIPSLRGKTPSTFCPTCDTTKSYVDLSGNEVPCDCPTQFALHKLYLAAGIGTEFQRMTSADYYGEPKPLQLVERYLNDGFWRRGMGLFFHGTFGSGKTMLANLALKHLIKINGLSCFATTFGSMIEMYSDGWRDRDDREYFLAKVVNSDVLLLDDIGKTMRASAAGRNFHESTFDDVLRTRVTAGKPTLVTTNMEMDEVGDGYGAAILSLLTRQSILCRFSGEDYSKKFNSRVTDELLAGRRRAIS